MSINIQTYRQQMMEFHLSDAAKARIVAGVEEKLAAYKKPAVSAGTWRVIGTVAAVLVAVVAVGAWLLIGLGLRNGKIQEEDPAVVDTDVKADPGQPGDADVQPDDNTPSGTEGVAPSVTDKTDPPAPQQDKTGTDGKTPAPDKTPDKTPDESAGAVPDGTPDDGDTKLSPKYIASMPFSPYEVVVTLTAEESAKGKTYTPADFPQVDVFNVFEYDYFPTEYYPDYADKTTLFLMLNKPDKATVLDYIDKLKTDSRVFNACVNVLEIDGNYFAAIVSKEQAEKQTYYTKDDFPDAKLRFIYANEKIIQGNHNTDYYPNTIAGTETAEQRTMFPSVYYNDGIDGIIDAMKSMLADDRIEACIPVYTCAPYKNYLECDFLAPEGTELSEVLTVITDEIKEKYSIKSIECIKTENVVASRKTNGYKNENCVNYSLKVEFNNPDPYTIEQAYLEIEKSAKSDPMLSIGRKRESGKCSLGYIN